MNQIAAPALASPAQAAWLDSETNTTDSAFRQLREEYQAQQALFEAQPLAVRQFLESQAARLAEALVQRQRQVQFALPEQVSVQAHGRSGEGLLVVPAEFRRQVVAGLLGRLPVGDIRTAVRQRLNQLEQSLHQAVTVSARLVRYATVRHIVHDMLPAGQSFTYVAGEGAAILTDPSANADSSASVALRFYMPQWVVLNDDRLLVDSVAEAEARVADMQRYLSTLHLAASLAPYIFADEEYQRKRFGMLGQFVHQGRALARYQTSDIIHRIERKAAEHELDRGFSLSLPYFDDQMLEMRQLDFEVIPAGRTMFVPAFVVLAARREQERVAQDKRLSHSTCMHLLSELKALERAFEPQL